MSWVTIIWSTVASACLTLAAVNLLVWCRKRTAWANLLFSSTAVATAAMAFCELRMMLAGTPGHFGAALSWLQVSAFVLIVSLVGFVLFHMRAGRPWLARTTCTLRACSLLLNFLTGQNLNYREVTGLRHIPFLGESVSVGEGVSNPWMLVGQLSLLLFVVFVADATLTVWRRGDRRHLLATGVSIVFFVLVGTVESVMVLWQMVHWPYAPSFCFLGIIAAMAYEMSRDTLRAAQLSDDLQKSQQELQAILDGTPSLVYVKDLEGRFLLVNRRFESVFALPREKLIGKSTHDLLPRQTADALRAADLEVMGKRGEVFIEEVRDEPDGRHTYLSVKFPLLDASGKVYAVCGISTDITRHKRAELELQQQRDELAHLARVMTLGELSGSLAHELNQPLAIILTNAQAAQRLLAQQPPDLAEARDILADIVSEDERAGEVIRRLRALLKPGQLQLVPLSVVDLIQDVFRIARTDLIARGIVVHTPPGESVPQVLGDRIQLEQVILNLILNAGDAMVTNPPSRRHLTIGTAHHGGAVRISVSDTGCGLPPDAERVFKPFYTTKKNGLGLGLAICRSIATAHNGRLWAEPNVAAGTPGASNAGHGSTFHFELPALAEDEP